jgi:hypothetical protein
VWKAAEIAWKQHRAEMAKESFESYIKPSLKNGL